MTQTFNCPTCGAPLDYEGGPDLTLRCPFCGNTVIVPESLRTGSASRPASPPEAASENKVLNQLPEWAEIGRLVRDGNKIEAIKIFRRLTGAGLSESKAAIDKIAEGRAFEVANYAIVLDQKNIPAEEHDRASQIHRIGQMLKQGKKTDAIAAYRALFNVDLAEAARAVEQLETTIDTPGAFDLHPPTVGTRVVARSEPAASSPWWLLPGIIVGVIGLVFGCYALATLDEYDTMDISILWRGTPTYTPEPTEELPATEAPLDTPTPAPTSTPEFASASILAACIGDSRGCFEEGRYVGVDGAENIYAGEANGRIQIFDSTGEYEAEFRTVGDETSLKSLAVDRQGIVYAVHGGAIYRYGGLPGGAPGDPLGPLEYEGGLGFQSVAALPEGGLVAAWNKDWRGGLFTNFTESQDDVVIFDVNGSVVQVIAQALSVAAGGGPELDTVVGADSEGNIYLSGLLNRGIYKFSPDGRFLDKFGENELEGANVFAIAVDGQGRVYVSGMGGGQTLVFDANGRVLAMLDYGGYGLAFTDDGRLLTLDDHQLFEFTILR